MYDSVYIPDYNSYVAESVTLFRREVLNVSDVQFEALKLAMYERTTLGGRVRGRWRG